MTIEEIKSRLTIKTVLAYYGLVADRNGMVNCPFHQDKKSSMRVYEKTNTVYCFAASCKVESVDVIDFILHQENLTAGGSCSKHEAILKAKSLCGTPLESIKEPIVKPNPMNNPFSAFKRYRKSIDTNKRAQEYCESRCLDWRVMEIGYKSNKTSDRWARGCIIFPLLDESGNIISLYGRSINGGGHYYQTARKGLYPEYPSGSTRYLILFESIIDAATLQSIELPLENYALLSLYGTNGLTEEHLQAIQKLSGLEEIIFALDEDEAGRAAIAKYEVSLSRMHPGARQSKLVLPEGEDINSLATGHEHRQSLFKELIENRTSLKETRSAPSGINLRSDKVGSHLDTSDAYRTPVATYYIKGGVRCSTKDLSSMKITLVVVNGEGKKSRNGLDLYEDRQIERVSRHIADRLGLRADLVELDLHALTDELEIYRKKVQEEGKEGQSKKRKLSPTQREKAITFWKSKNLMKRIDDVLKEYGIIGEENNRRLGFCIASSSQMREPLQGLIQGSSGSGKTYLLSNLCSLIPPENYLPITRATDNSFYNYGKYDLKNKLISIEDKDSMSEEANLAFRELQSKGMVSLSTTGQDEKGHNRSYVKEVFGPIASLACTTKGELYLDDMNRCFLLAVDEGEVQTKRILEHQKRAAAGEVKRQKKEAITAFMQSALRLLEPYEVVIPQATKISLPEEVKDKRRLNSLYLSLVKQITILHQYQRSKNEAGQLIATKEDLKLANEIMFEAIVLKVDDLHGSLRSFYETLKNYIRQEAGEQAQKYEFIQREIRHWMRKSNSYVKGHIRSLQELGYLQISGGSEYRGHKYQLIYWDDNEGMRQRIKIYLSEQISKIGN